MWERRYGCPGINFNLRSCRSCFFMVPKRPFPIDSLLQMIVRFEIAVPDPSYTLSSNVPRSLVPLNPYFRLVQ